MREDARREGERAVVAPAAEAALRRPRHRSGSRGPRPRPPSAARLASRQRRPGLRGTAWNRMGGVGFGDGERREGEREREASGGGEETSMRGDGGEETRR